MAASGAVDLGLRLRRGLGQAAALVGVGLIAGGVALFAAWREAPAVESPYTYRLPLVAGPGVDEEIAFYQLRVAHYPDGFLDLVSLGQAYARKARVTSDPSYYLLAEQAARRSLAALPTSNDGATMLLARVAIARHHFPEALTLAESVEKAGRLSGGVVSAYATIYLTQGELAKAEKAVKLLVKVNPGLDTYSQLGLVRTAEGRDAEAVQAFERAIALEQAGDREGSAMARAWLGRLHLRRGRLGEASLLLTEANRILPGHAVVLSLLAELAMHEQRFSDAELLATQAYTADQSSVHLAAQARARVAEGDRAGAATLREQAIAQLRRDLAASDFGHRRDLARVLLERGSAGDAASALTLLDAELAMRHDSESLELRGWALGALGRWREAAQDLDRALGTGAHDAPLLARRAWVARNLGDVASATAYASRARAADPTLAADPALAATLATLGSAPAR